jgi:hypothetical protein
MYLFVLAAKSAKTAAKKATNKVTDMAENTGNAVASGKDCFFNELIEVIRKMNFFTLHCYNNLIQLTDHYLGAKNATKSAKDATEQAFHGTKNAGKKGD